MYKHTALLVRKDGMSHESFVDHWQTTHTPIAREIEGVVRYHQVLPVDAGSAEFDGIAELYFEELDALYDALGSEGSRDYDPEKETAKQAREDVDNFLDIHRRPRFIGRETVEWDSVGGDTDGLYKQSTFLVREDASREAFRERWAEQVPDPEELPGVVRYTRVAPTDPAYAEFDGVTELYFEEPDQVIDATPQGCDPVHRFVGRERLIKDETNHV